MSRTSDWADLIGRALLSLIFILGGINKAFHFDQSQAYMSSQGVPATHLLLAVAIVIELVGGLGILLGRFTRTMASLLFLYLIPVTYYMHGFWHATGPMAQEELAHFLKNVALMGAFLFVASHHPGRFSIDSLIYRARERERAAAGERRIRAA